MKIYKINPINFKALKAPYMYETDGITNYMVRLPMSRHWRRVYVHSGNGGRALWMHSGDMDFDMNSFTYYVADKGERSNFIPVELPFDEADENMRIILKTS